MAIRSTTPRGGEPIRQRDDAIEDRDPVAGGGERTTLSVAQAPNDHCDEDADCKQQTKLMKHGRLLVLEVLPTADKQRCCQRFRGDARKSPAPNPGGASFFGGYGTDPSCNGPADSDNVEPDALFQKRSPTVGDGGASQGCDLDFVFLPRPTMTGARKDCLKSHG
jgi:hypothetical protein